MSEKRKKESSREEYQKGDKLHGQKKWDAAILSYTRAIELDPEYELAWYSRGVCHHKKGEYDLAIADYTEAIRLNPKDAMNHRSRGISYHMKGEHDLAIADKTEAIRLNPEEARNYRSRGIGYHFKGEYDLAIADYAEAFRLNPEDDQTFEARACAYAAMKKYSLAEDDFSSSIALGASGSSHARRGLMRQFQGKTVEAIADFATALKLNPKSPRVCCHHVVALWLQGKAEEAEKELIRGFALQPSFESFTDEMKLLPPIAPIFRAILRELSPSKMKLALEATVVEIAGPGAVEPTQQSAAREPRVVEITGPGTVGPTLQPRASSFRVLPGAAEEDCRFAPPPAAAASDPLMDFLKELHLERYCKTFEDAGVTCHHLPAFLLPGCDQLLRKVIPGDKLGPVLARAQFVAKVKDLQASPRLSAQVVTDSGELDRRNVKVYHDQVLGRGGFGVVYLGRLIQEGVDVAVKEIPLHDLSLIKKEVETMTRLSNKNILRVHGWWFDDKIKIASVVMELCANDSLAKFVGSGGVGPSPAPPDLRTRLSYLASVCSGMEYVHRCGVVHYDLKPANVLLTSGNVVKICDFGISRNAVTATPGSVRGTPRFIPKSKPPRTPLECDVYAFSITAYEVLSGKQAFEDILGRFEGQHLVEEIHNHGVFPNLDVDLPGVSVSVKKAILHCWSSNPMKWPSFSQLLRVFRDAALGSKSWGKKSGSSLLIEG